MKPTSKFKAFVSAFALVAASTAQAQSKPLFQVLACPDVGQEYEQMIAKLDAIKTSIKKDANCQDVELKVKSLEDLVTKDRQTVMDIVDNANGLPLTEAQSKTVRDYAENVTKKVAALNDLFTGSNYCFRDDKANDQLTSLAGFVGEASQLVGSLTGPWGAPIALAGNVIAGFMTGLDGIFKTRAGYDFSKRAEWASYVHSLCTYASYRDQIGHLLDPAQRLKELSELKSQLDTQIAIMANVCSDCRSMLNSFEAQKAQGSAALFQIFGANIDRADRQFSKPYGTYMLQSLGLRDWVVGEQARVTKEAQTYWADATGRHLLSQAKDDIEDFLITRQAPKFLSMGITVSRDDYTQFVAFIGQEGRPLYDAFDQADRNLLGGRIGNPGWTNPLAFFDALILTPIDWTRATGNAGLEELQYQWTHFRDQGLDRFRNAQASLQVEQTFCAFFRHAGLYSSSIKEVCASSYMTQMVTQQNALAAKLIAAGVVGASAPQPLAEPPGSDATVYVSRFQALTKTIEVRNLAQ